MAKKTRNARIINKIITTPGAIATIPPSDDHTDGTWVETDIYEGEYLFNTYDKKVFSRMGNIIVDVDFGIVPNFTVSGAIPDTIDEQSTGNAVVVTGTRFKDNMTVRIPDVNGLGFSNISLTYINTTSLQVNFDVAGDITTDKTFTIYLDKEGYETSFHMNADVDLEITGDNKSSILEISPSENVLFYINESITNITLVETNNVNITVNSNEPASSGDGVAEPFNFIVNFNSSGASFDEVFSVRVVGDGETSPWYTMAVEPTLEILSISPDPVPFTLDYNLDTVVSPAMNKSVNITSAEFDDPRVSLYAVSGSNLILNTVGLDKNDIFNLRVIGDGETTPWFETTMGEVYNAVNEIGTILVLRFGSFTGEAITGWDRTSNPYLYFELINIEEVPYLYGYLSDADRTLGIDSSVFYLANDTTIVATNSSGFGGTFKWNNEGPSFGDKMYLRAGGYSYVETNETGSPATLVNGWSGLLGWDRDSTPSLYLYYSGTAAGGGQPGWEVYDNASSRDSRTSVDKLCVLPANSTNFIEEHNSSGFTGKMSDVSTTTEGSKMYVTAS